MISSVVRRFSDLDATFLSASQHRKSRAGRSFEQHISRLLRDGRIVFEEQAVTGGHRPDFVLPSLVVLVAKKRKFEEAMVLSAKTTLRERWKQAPDLRDGAQLNLRKISSCVGVFFFGRLTKERSFSMIRWSCAIHELEI